MIEFQAEGFRLDRRPKYNKRERSYLGISKDPIKVIETARGFIKRKGTLRYIQKTSAIVSREFDTATGYLLLKTENGKRYCVPYKEVYHAELEAT